MKKIIILLFAVFFYHNSHAQCKKEIESYIHEYYDHFKTGDSNWFKNHLMDTAWFNNQYDKNISKSSAQYQKDLQKYIFYAKRDIKSHIIIINQYLNNREPYNLSWEKSYIRKFIYPQWEQFLPGPVYMHLVISDDHIENVLQFSVSVDTLNQCRTRAAGSPTLWMSYIYNEEKDSLEDHSGIIYKKNGKLTYALIESKDNVQVNVEQMPIFMNGLDSLNSYLAKNIKYPIIAYHNQISGVVYIEFVVNEDGSIGNTKILKEIGGGCGAEAERVIRQMPKWIPGKQDGKTVKVKMTLPVNFYQ